MMKPFVKAKLQCHTISAATLVVYQEKICCVCTPIEVEDLVLVVMTLGDRSQVLNITLIFVCLLLLQSISVANFYNTGKNTTR